MALSVFLFCQCRKEKQDSISKQSINGMVYNNCTDSGLANVKVYFETYKENSKISSQETISNSNGNFTFSDAEIHSSGNFQYVIYIPSKSGIGANSPQYALFNGTKLHFTKEQAGEFLKPRVTPGFYRLCCVSMSNIDIKYPDSMYCVFEQKKFHNNVPTLPYKLFNGAISQMQSGYEYCHANYPMGLWNITIEKWKNGIYTMEHDSIYIEWAGVNTYTITW